MELEIKKVKGVFYLTGSITSTTLPYLKNHFNYTVDLGPNIILNIRGIRRIDEYGMKALEELYEQILCMNQRLCITGLQYNQLRNDIGGSILIA